MLRPVVVHLGRTSTTISDMSELEGFHHVALTVSDRDRSAEWYEKTLGFHELFREEGEHRRACVMRFEHGGYGVGLVEHVPSDEGDFDPTRRGLDHLAFTVASNEDIDEWATRLTLAGVAHSGVIDVPSGAILNFKDPDGIGLALFWERD
jgi:glyoxylase I family protein